MPGPEGTPARSSLRHVLGVLSPDYASLNKPQIPRILGQRSNPCGNHTLPAQTLLSRPVVKCKRLRRDNGIPSTRSSETQNFPQWPVRRCGTFGWKATPT